MFFSASARLAEATSDFGDLAERFDSYLSQATEAWLIQADAVADELRVPREKADYLLEKAAAPEVGLLVGERYLRCPACLNLIPVEDVEEALEAEEELRCSQCSRQLTENEEEVTAYRLSDEAAGEARKRQERPKRRIAILTALELERLAVLAHLKEVRRENHPQGTVYQVGTFETEAAVWEIGTTSIGAGNAGAAAEAERVINHFTPEAALFVGIAGGIKDVDLGDVVVGDEVFLYHSGKAGGDFRANPQSYRPTHPLLSGARATVVEKRWQARIIDGSGGEPKAVVGPIAAGEQVVASRRAPTYELIREHYGRVVAVEMEGGGFLRGTYGNQNVGSLVVRGISDMLGNKAETDATGWQPRAAANAAAFAFEVISTLP